MSVEEIQARLTAARDHLGRAAKALAPRHQGGEWDEFRAAREVVLGLERELAAIRGEEHAVPLDFSVQWDTGAPLPHLLRNDYRTLLLFHVREANPDWDGSRLIIKDPGSGTVESLALVEFTGCISAKLGSPNDEVFCGHPLHGRGLDGYTAQRVVNSRWLAELETINRVHRGYSPEFWKRKRHLILWFHDTTFECVAESFSVELYRESVADLLTRACRRLLG